MILFETACGVCSTLQDLAAYIVHTDLTKIGTICDAEALIDFDRGIKCFLRFGFTHVSATIILFLKPNILSDLHLHT